MVQGVVTRLAGNSAQMKTWAVSLVTAIIVFSGLSKNPHWLVGAGGFVPVLGLWFMDTRYLHLEKRYRALHEAIVAGKEITPFSLDHEQYSREVDSICKVARSWSVSLFYGPLAAVMVALSVFLAI